MHLNDLEKSTVTPDSHWVGNNLQAKRAFSIIRTQNVSIVLWAFCRASVGAAMQNVAVRV